MDDDERLEDIERRLNGARTSLRHITQATGHLVDRIEADEKRLDTIEEMLQLCIDQGKYFSGAITQMKKRLDEAGL